MKRNTFILLLIALILLILDSCAPLLNTIIISDKLYSLNDYDTSIVDLYSYFDTLNVDKVPLNKWSKGAIVNKNGNYSSTSIINYRKKNTMYTFRYSYIEEDDSSYYNYQIVCFTSDKKIIEKYK